MARFKKMLGMVLVTVFALMTFLSNTAASAATKPVVVPQVKFVDQPQTEYTAGDMVKFNLHAPNYGGKVQYRVVLWHDETKSYKDLWETGDRYYTNWKPSGGTLFNLHWIINEPGHYRLTIFVKRADLPNTKTALKDQNCDSFMAGVPFVVKSKDPTVYLDKQAQVYGSSDSQKPEVVKNDVKITAKNVRYENANVEGNLYILANDVMLKNIKVTGTVFVDPGKDGNTILDNVTAKEIKVLSGGENSIHLRSVDAENLIVESTSKVRVETTGTTKVGKTQVTSYAVFDSKGGNLGTITVAKSESGKYEVEFKGTFTEPIVVETETTIKAAADANIAKVEIAPENKDAAVELKGAFKEVEVTKEAKVELAADTVVRDTFKVAAAVELKAAETAKVLKIDVETKNSDESVKLEGKNLGLVDVKSATKIVIPDGTKASVVVNSKGAEVSVAKTAQVSLDAKGNDVKTSGEGSAVKADLSKLEKSVNDVISANKAVDKVEAEKAAAEAAAQNAKTEAEKAAAEAAAKAAEEAAAKAAADKAAAEAAAKEAQGEVTPEQPPTAPVGGGGGGSTGGDDDDDTPRDPNKVNLASKLQEYVVPGYLRITPDVSDEKIKAQVLDKSAKMIDVIDISRIGTGAEPITAIIGNDDYDLSKDISKPQRIVSLMGDILVHFFPNNYSEKIFGDITLGELMNTHITINVEYNGDHYILELQE